MKKRVLFVSCEGLGNGGVQAIIMGIVRNLSNNFHFDILLFTSEKRYYDDEFLSYGGKIFRIPKYEGSNSFLKRLDYYVRDIYTYARLNRILRNEMPYDAIHCNREYENAPILMLASMYKIPVRISQAHVVHGKTNSICTMLDNFRLKIANKYATKRIGCSINACESLFSKEAKYDVVNNFYDDSRFYPRSLRDYNTDKLTLVQVGAISTVKNQQFSIDVLYALLKKDLHVRLRIVGFDMDVNYKESLIKKILELKLTDYVDFFPGDIDIPIILAKSSCFIMPSKHEGFGIALVEAQAVGLHCFASDRIPQITNCGGVEFLPLDNGAHYWANRIATWSIQKKPDCIDTSRYQLSFVIEEYKQMYNNKR